ncbi:MAG: peptidoglycan recognition protein family protein [Dermatophilaceae bacterium]
MPVTLDDTRAAWNARPPTRPRTPVAKADRIGVSYHWIGPGSGKFADHADCLSKVRAWQHMHQTRPGDPWKDIGYNVLICWHARLIEGRGLDYSGSHSPGVNTSHIGLQFMCGEGDAPPSEAMQDRARRFRREAGAEYPNVRRDWAHRDDPEASTACPGDWIDNWVAQGGPTEAAAPTPPPTPEDDMTPAESQKLTDVDNRVDGIANKILPTVNARLVVIDDKVDRLEARMIQLLEAVQRP